MSVVCEWRAQASCSQTAAPLPRSLSGALHAAGSAPVRVVVYAQLTQQRWRILSQRIELQSLRLRAVS